MPGKPSILEGTVEQLIPRETCLLMSSWVFQPSAEGWSGKGEWDNTGSSWIIESSQLLNHWSEKIQRHVTICYNCMTYNISFLLYSLKYVPQRTTPIFTQTHVYTFLGLIFYPLAFSAWNLIHLSPSLLGPLTPEIEGCCDVFPFLWALATSFTRDCMKHA